MSEIAVVIESEIERLEQSLRADARYRKLVLLRGLQGEYEGEAPAPRQLAAPAPTGKTGRKKRGGRRGRPPKPATPKASATKKGKRRPARAPDEKDELVLAAIISIQNAGESPNRAAIEAKADCAASIVAKSITSLIKNKRIKPLGGPRNRTFEILGGAPKRRDVKLEKEEEDDVLLALVLVKKDDASVKAISKQASTLAADIPPVLERLRARGLVSVDDDLWSLTDAGKTAAIELASA